MRLIDRSLADGVDDLFYLDKYGDILNAFNASSTFDPSNHYLTQGGLAAEQRSPNALFDDGYYRAQASAISNSVTALSHYLTTGAAAGYDPSAYLDTSSYLTANGDVAAAGANPLLHFLQFGGEEGRRRVSNVDDVFYTLYYGDIAAAAVDPYYHAITHGLVTEGRIGTAPGDTMTGQVGLAGAQNFVGDANVGFGLSSTVTYANAPGQVLTDDNGDPRYRYNPVTGVFDQITVGVGVFMSYPPATIDKRSNPAGNHALGDTYTGINQVIGSGFDDYMQGFGGSVTLRGGEGDDVIRSLVVPSGGQVAYLFGDAGDDNIVGGPGVEHMDGGSSRPNIGDHVSYFISRAGVHAHLEPTRAYLNSGDAAGDTYTSIEVLIGAGNFLDGGVRTNFAVDDYLEGDSVNTTNQLQGQDGNDTLQAGTKDNGATNFIGGAGRDLYIGAFKIVNGVQVADQRGQTYFISYETVSDFQLTPGAAYDNDRKGVSVDLLVGASTPFGSGPYDNVANNAAAGDRFKFLTSADGVMNLGLAGSPFDDVILADNGNNVIVGDPTSVGYGRAGNDVIYGRDGDDFISGDDFTENPNALGGVDELHGGDGDDSLIGFEAGDVLYGDAGSDKLNGWTGGDVLSGGTGADQFYLTDDSHSRASAADYIIDFETGIDVLRLGPEANGVFTPQSYAVTILRVDSANGADSAYVFLDGDNNAMTTDDQAQIAVKGGLGNVINLSDLNVTFLGTPYLEGSSANETLRGSAIADSLAGAGGGDNLYGGAGADVLDGGAGGDNLFGEAGADIFRFRADSLTLTVQDSIRDFEAGLDKIDLTALNQAAGASYVVAAATGGFYIWVNSDAVGGADMGVFVWGSVAPTSADILF